MFLLFAVLLQFGDSLVLGFQGADALARILTLERQFRIGNPESLCTPSQALRGDRRAGQFGLLCEEAEEIDVMGENDYLALRGRNVSMTLRHLAS